MNRESYNAIAAQWDAARHSFYGREREYVEALLAGGPAQASVLDLGCGTGRPIATYLLAKGHAVTGVDFAESLLELARVRYPEATWIHADIEAFRPAQKADAVVCWDVLFHIERSKHARLLTKFAGMLRPGGRLMLTAGGSDHPAFTDTMYGRRFFYDSPPPGELLAMVERAGFQPIITEFMNLPTAGRDKGRYAVVARLGRDMQSS